MAKYTAVCALLLSLAVAAFAQDPSFPYCRCVDNKKSSSPYAVVLKSKSTGKTKTTATFSIAPVTPPSNPSECFKRILATGVPKIEFATSVACLAAGSVVVKINGVVSKTSGAVVPPNYNNKAAIKVQFKPNNYVGGAVSISIVGYGACADWSTLFLSGGPGIFQYTVFSEVISSSVCCPSGTVFPPPPSPPPPSPPPPHLPPSPPPPRTPRAPRSPNQPPSPPPPRAPRAPRSPNQPPSPPPPRTPRAPRSPNQPLSPPPPRTPRSPARPNAPIPPVTLTRPPLAPPPTPAFPFCRCQRSINNTPYRLASVAPANAQGGINWHTATIGTVACDTSKESCTFTLDRIEIHIRDGCKSSFYPTAYIQAAGGIPDARTVTFQDDGPGMLVAKVSRLGWTPAQANGATVKFGLKADGVCPGGEQLLPPGPRIAFFSPKNKFCPTFSIAP